MKPCFAPANILLPKEGSEFSKWAVVACDQFTSRPDYWKQAEEFVNGAPSTLNIIFPEAFLADEPEKRIAKITAAMKKYLSEDILTEAVHNGFVYVERKTSTGLRRGIIGTVDLEAYDFTPGTDKPIRATEGTVLSRIPPRLKIRHGAPLEVPHVMVLINDLKKEIIEPLDKEKNNFRKLYDFDLMLGGGAIKGYAIDGENARCLAQRIAVKEAESNGFFIAMGDGNHSLATAKAHWEEIRKNLTDEEAANHPARYSLVEMVNLHDESLKFEPIHRAVFGVDGADLFYSFEEYLAEKKMSKTEGNEITFIFNNREEHFSIDGKNSLLPVGILQDFIDKYIAEHSDASVDYIHGANEARSLAENGAVGILLKAFDKEELFPAIAAGGVLPRKTFSMGEANDKRYYIEARKIYM